MLDARELLERGINVGLGTDMSGGYSPSMYNALRNTIIASVTVSETRKGKQEPLSYEEAFYMATEGGAKTLGVGDKVGNFKEGLFFNAQVLDPFAPNSPFDTLQGQDSRQLLQKLLFLSDDRNISSVFVKGRKVV